MTDIKKPNYLLLFVRYVVKNIAASFADIPRNFVDGTRWIWHKFSYPTAWFYAVFSIYVMRYFLIKQRDPGEDTLIIIIMVILLLWQEYDKGDFIHEYRAEQRERLLKQAKEKYPPKPNEKEVR